MQQIFVNDEPIEGRFTVAGDDAHHLVHVVRLKSGERLRVSTPTGSYLCQVDQVDRDSLICRVLEPLPSTELSNSIYLFQALPKGDRMETIIEKTVELGVHEIIPVEMKNCIVKLDDKKKDSKLKRYQAIALSAAQQSKRSSVPVISSVMSFAQALEKAQECDTIVVPYESKNGMQDTYDFLNTLTAGQSVAVFIGPEGGFDDSEIDRLVSAGAAIISLGRRILRTDTAAISALTMLMLKSEEFEQ